MKSAAIMDKASKSQLGSRRGVAGHTSLLRKGFP